MASVHLAWQPALERDVALKELHSVHLTDATLARRFLRESRVGGTLNHPSIVSVIEYFEDDGVPFIAMEYLERGSLRPLVGRLTLAQVAGVLESVLAGLAEAGTRGIVHRDLKPENVLVTADGHVKVADFGIAKAIGQSCVTEFRTATGQIVGTPAYMAPEQVMGGEVTPQADLYALGLMAYELLAGEHPFGACDVPIALLMRHLNGEPPSLARLRPDVPAGVAAWVGRLLERDPGARPAGAARAWEELEGAVCEALGPRWRRAAELPEPGAMPVAVAVPAPVAMPGPVVAPEPPAVDAATRVMPVPGDPPTRRRSTPALVAAAVLVLVTAALLSLSAGHGPGASQAPRSSLERAAPAATTPAARRAHGSRRRRRYRPRR
jgi:hypothetical protein